MEIRAPYYAVFLVIALMWLVFAVNLLVPAMDLNALGIAPRTLLGLRGIVFSPFLHADLLHLVSNSLGVVLVSLLVTISVGRQKMLSALLLSVLFSGLWTWLFSLASVVIGASGVVYSLIGVLFSYARYSPSLRSWLSALLALFIFSGTLLALFRLDPDISWAAHAGGLISGLLIGRLLIGNRPFRASCKG